jgi:hypothetical protein
MHVHLRLRSSESYFEVNKMRRYGDDMRKCQIRLTNGQDKACETYLFLPRAPCARCKVILSRSLAVLAAVFRDYPGGYASRQPGCTAVRYVIAMEARPPAPSVVTFPLAAALIRQVQAEVDYRVSGAANKQRTPPGK